jgi:hypothetical protein
MGNIEYIRRPLISLTGFGVILKQFDKVQKQKSLQIQRFAALVCFEIDSSVPDGN